MQLSEAIRLGAMLHPQQAFGTYRRFNDEGQVVATCAIGAAGQAGYRGDEHRSVLLMRTSCPVCEFREALRCVVAHLNDKHLWTREKIADWVATIELTEQEQPVREAVTA